LGILLVLKEKGSISQHDIGQCVHIDRTTMVAMIDDLEKLGMVERKGHPTDRRSHMVYLTPKGKEILPKAHGLARTSQNKLLSSLTGREQKALIELLRKLVLTHFADKKGKENS
jgi:DNA-binding MarR family transcriptional regulator